jgi:hypothetical protein
MMTRTSFRTIRLAWRLYHLLCGFSPLGSRRVAIYLMRRGSLEFKRSRDTTRLAFFLSSVPLQRKALIKE